MTAPAPGALAALAMSRQRRSAAARRCDCKRKARSSSAKRLPPCALCHTLDAAGAAGAVGPSLDELKPDAERVATALRNGVGAMPSYRATLSDAQITLLARYVAQASGGEK